MCHECEERIFTTVFLIAKCPKKEGLPYTGKCEYCDAPVYVYHHQRAGKPTGKFSHYNRDGRLHKDTCPALYSREAKGRICRRTMNTYKPKDEEPIYRYAPKDSDK